jgi:AraC family transcriptional regulator
MDSFEQSAESYLAIDFASATSSGPDGIGFSKMVRLGSITLAHCFFRPNDGVHVGASQVTVGLYDGASFEMDWRSPESDRLQSGAMSRGQAHIGDGRLPLWVRCRTSPSFFAFAMDETFIRAICESTFDQMTDYALKTSIGVEDPVLARIGALGQFELDHGGASGRLYLEGLASALAIHLLRKYALSNRRLSFHKGGLAPAQLRRVIAYIEENLTDDLGITELAAITGHSPHHFIQAFKSATGLTPHRYVIRQRVHRACDLLRDANLPVVEIAHAVGFSSQSHLTINFRRLTGVTPARFRRLEI